MMPCFEPVLIDQPRPPARDHPRHERLGAVDHPPEVDRRASAPSRRAAEDPAARPDPGVVHQHVGAAEALPHRRLQRRDRRGVARRRSPRHHRPRPARRGLGERRGRGRQPVGAEVGDADPHARPPRTASPPPGRCPDAPPVTTATASAVSAGCAMFPSYAGVC